jgi:hypothetical protein
MSKYISFNLHFLGDISPASLVSGFLQAGFNDFLRPKIGKVKVDDNVLEFGHCPLDQISSTALPIEGERILVPGITSLAQYPDATQEIIDFLAQFSRPTWSFAEFVGDYRLDYTENTNAVEEWVFRYGNDSWRFPIVRCYASMPFSRTGMGILISCPWFFLKNWWPEDSEPCYITPEIAEHNWTRMIECVQSIINAVDKDKLEETYLDFEGSLVYQEREWLVGYAQQLSKLQVHVA